MNPEKYLALELRTLYFMPSNIDFLFFFFVIHPTEWVLDPY